METVSLGRLCINLFIHEVKFSIILVENQYRPSYSHTKLHECIHRFTNFTKVANNQKCFAQSSYIAKIF